MFAKIRQFFSSLHQPVLHVAFDKGSRRSGSTIVFLHGIAATSKTWKELQDRLDYSEHRVIALDLLGFGGSPRPDKCQYTPDEHCQAIHRTLKKCGVKKPFILVAHSMGSLLGVHYMTKWPKDVSRAVLVGMPVYLDASGLKGISRLQNSFYRQAYKFFRSHKNFTVDGAQTIRKLLKLDEGIDVTHDDWRSFSLSLRNTIEKQNTYNELREINVPLTLIYGTLDEFAVRSNIVEITKMHDTITTQLVRGSDHVVDAKIAKTIVNTLKKDV